MYEIKNWHYFFLPCSYVKIVKKKMEKNNLIFLCFKFLLNMLFMFCLYMHGGLWKIGRMSGSEPFGLCDAGSGKSEESFTWKTVPWNLVKLDGSSHVVASYRSKNFQWHPWIIQKTTTEENKVPMNHFNPFNTWTIIYTSSQTNQDSEKFHPSTKRKRKIIIKKKNLVPTHEYVIKSI